MRPVLSLIFSPLLLFRSNAAPSSRPSGLTKTHSPNLLALSQSNVTLTTPGARIVNISTSHNRPHVTCSPAISPPVFSTINMIDCNEAFDRLPYIVSGKPFWFSLDSENPSHKLPQSFAVGSCGVRVDFAPGRSVEYTSRWDVRWSAMFVGLKCVLGGNRTGLSAWVGLRDGIRVAVWNPNQVRISSRRRLG